MILWLSKKAHNNVSIFSKIFIFSFLDSSLFCGVILYISRFWNIKWLHDGNYLEKEIRKIWSYYSEIILHLTISKKKLNLLVTLSIESIRTIVSTPLMHASKKKMHLTISRTILFSLVFQIPLLHLILLFLVPEDTDELLSIEGSLFWVNSDSISLFLSWQSKIHLIPPLVIFCIIYIFCVWKRLVNI